MAGFIPAIHVLGFSNEKNVDGRDEPGHDEQYKFVLQLARLRLPDLGQFDLDPQFDFRQHGIEAGIAG